jgi:hypothetical protein
MPSDAELGRRRSEDGHHGGCNLAGLSHPCEEVRIRWLASGFAGAAPGALAGGRAGPRMAVAAPVAVTGQALLCHDAALRPACPCLPVAGAVVLALVGGRHVAVTVVPSVAANGAAWLPTGGFGGQLLRRRPAAAASGSASWAACGCGGPRAYEWGCRPGGDWQRRCAPSTVTGESVNGCTRCGDDRHCQRAPPIVTDESERLHDVWR